jgi:4'-phosphopantetheinyl transferase EntD
MSAANNFSLYDAIEAARPPALLVNYRAIAEGDEYALLPEELEALLPRAVKVRRASGAARIVARDLMARLGCGRQAVPRSPSGMPLWPAGLVGSLAHDSRISLAAVALKREFLSVGVDVEPAEALEPDVLGLVVTDKEQRNIHEDLMLGRLVFSIKESVYKATYPLDGAFLDHQDVEVCLSSKTAIVRNGRIVNFCYCIATHIVTLAFVPT